MWPGGGCLHRWCLPCCATASLAQSNIISSITLSYHRSLPGNGASMIFDFCITLACIPYLLKVYLVHQACVSPFNNSNGMAHASPNSSLLKGLASFWQKARNNDSESKRNVEGLPPLRYDQLPSPTAFRVLHLLPDKRDRIVKCSLQVVKIEDMTEDMHFVALSYTWGEQQPSVKIICDDQVALVTPALHDALVRFRREKDVYTVWADAISISQTDSDEKSAQVLLIRHIFSKASMVAAYLGEANFEYTAFAKLWDLCTILSQKVPRVTLLSLEPGSQWWQALGLPPRDSPLWQHLIRFCTHPWFRRVWIVQEACLVKDVSITYGMFTAPLYDVLLCLELMHSSGLAGVLMRVADSQSRALLHSDCTYYRFLRIHRTRTQEQKSLPLQELLIRSPAHGATDLRDQVFALLGLTSEPDAAGLRPDYNSSAAEVYIRACEYMLRSAKTLLFLYDCSLQTSHALPSWVPDWSTENEAASLTREIELPPGIYNAAGGRELSFQIDPKAGLLWLKGAMVDTIAQIGANHWETMKGAGVEGDPHSRDPVGESAWFTESLELAKRATSSLAYDSSLRHVHLATLTAHNPSSPFTHTLTKTACNEQFWAQYDTFRRVVETGRHPMDPSEIELFVEACSRVSIGRRICLTSRGYLAHVPAEAEIGDTIAVFLGAIVPFVIRRKPEKTTEHQIVGECYVHGLMKGEGLDLSDVSVEDIVLG